MIFFLLSSQTLQFSSDVNIFKVPFFRCSLVELTRHDILLRQPHKKDVSLYKKIRPAQSTVGREGQYLRFSQKNIYIPIPQILRVCIECIEFRRNFYMFESKRLEQVSRIYALGCHQSRSSLEVILIDCPRRSSKMACRITTISNL